MKHPARSDFDILVTEAGVSVTFKQTNSIYSFYRLTDANNIARVGPVSYAGVRHAGRGAGDYASDEVQDMARRIASEFALSFRSVLEEALAVVRSERVHNITHVKPVSLASVPRRVASEIDAILGLIQNLDKDD